MKSTPHGFTHARISALASALPSVAVPSSFWDDHFNLPRGTIAQRTGVLHRYRCGPGESSLTLAGTAIQRALDEAALKPRDIGLVIDCSAGIWQPLPSNAACLLESLGNEWAGIPGMDVRNTCLGFVTALDVAQTMITRHPHIIVVGSETPFAVLRHNDPESAPLFGEGAAAAIVSASPNRRPYYFAMEVFAAYRSACEIAAGGLRAPAFAHTTDNDASYRFAMDGARVHRAASKHLPDLIRRFRSCWPEDNRNLWIPHPASGPAVELLRRRLHISAVRFFCTIAEHGNLISAGIPHQMALARHRLGRLSHFTLVGTAAGYSQAVMAWQHSDET